MAAYLIPHNTVSRHSFFDVTSTASVSDRPSLVSSRHSYISSTIRPRTKSVSKLSSDVFSSSSTDQFFLSGSQAQATAARKRSESTQSVFGNLKGRLKRRPSAPLLTESFLDMSDADHTSILGKFVSKAALETLSLERLFEKAHSSPGRNIQTAEAPLDREVQVDPQLASESLPPKNVDVVEDSFEPKGWFMKQNEMKLHPYNRSKAPYMQAYNQAVLSNDFYAYSLLKLCNESEGPSFHNYGSSPPSNVLDLGCGQGLWVLDAAAAWASSGTKVIGFDLVDLISASDTPANVEWKRGNFVEYVLPFADESFDLVRLANLTLCIPQDRWEFVLYEVFRVLAPGGRVEIVDDEMIFPYASSIRHALSSPRTAVSSRAIDDQDTFLRATPSSSRSSSASSTEQSQMTSSGVIYNRHPISLYDEQISTGAGSSGSTSFASDSSIGTQSDILESPVMNKYGVVKQENESYQDIDSLRECFLLENLFEAMLSNHYGIDTQPHAFLLPLLKTIFGLEGEANIIKVQQVFLPEDLTSDTLSRGCTRARSRFSLFEPDSTIKRSDKYLEKNISLQDDIIPVATNGNLNSKAAKVLGVDTFDSAEERLDVFPTSINRYATNGDVSYSDSYSPSYVLDDASNSYQGYSDKGQLKTLRINAVLQPTGLYLPPGRFIPLTNTEVEMHACKNVQVLLGCRQSLKEYTCGFKDEQGGRLIEDEFWDRLIWQYECLRRRRLNLPDFLNMNTSEDEDEDERKFTDKRDFSRLANSTVRSRNGNKRTKYCSGSLVRVIRVFEAYKPKRS